MAASASSTAAAQRTQLQGSTQTCRCWARCAQTSARRTRRREILAVGDVHLRDDCGAVACLHGYTAAIVGGLRRCGGQLRPRFLQMRFVYSGGGVARRRAGRPAVAAATVLGPLLEVALRKVRSRQLAEALQAAPRRDIAPCATSSPRAGTARRSSARGGSLVHSSSASSAPHAAQLRRTSEAASTGFGGASLRPAPPGAGARCVFIVVCRACGNWKTAASTERASHKRPEKGKHGARTCEWKNLSGQRYPSNGG
jgi:hypothetical protein